MSSVQPFQSEPEHIDRKNNEEIAQNVLENEDDQMDEEERVGQNSWCFYSSCLAMPTWRESVCCNELNELHHFLSASVHRKQRDQTYSHIDWSSALHII